MKIHKEQNIILNSALGKTSAYVDHYSPELLLPIPRHLKRAEIGITGALPFYGFDTWNDYETSWLDSRGKPIVAITQFHIPCTSPNIVESKSIKLYLNSLSNTQFSSPDDVKNVIQKDLSKNAGSDVIVTIHTLDALAGLSVGKPPGHCIDGLNTTIEKYEAYPRYLQCTSDTITTETLHSNLLKSNCPVTAQPDWATLIVEYTGKQLSREGLLKYIVSLRNQQEFHEQCIERIFVNIMEYCQPQALTVIGRYTRRGGKDINPCRSTNPDIGILNQRLIRQ
ncbi:MAG: NADPH-dependent 7-cyano-7-deazaguanine reductase QueF [Coxiella sp. (in: Bacteria)]|nr:MAG: NADPH-dependent 7-cyano-7-deazaguanine reductase QueF [Coxiella sp. (in: g-proteobacteria)]